MFWHFYFSGPFGPSGSTHGSPKHSNQDYLRASGSHIWHQKFFLGPSLNRHWYVMVHRPVNSAQNFNFYLKSAPILNADLF